MITVTLHLETIGMKHIEVSWENLALGFLGYSLITITYPLYMADRILPNRFFKDILGGTANVLEDIQDKMKERK